MKAVVAVLVSLGALSGLAVAYGGWWPFLDALCAEGWLLIGWLELLERKARRAQEEQALCSEQDRRWLEENAGAQLPEVKREIR